jgi:mannose-6-phosphate isomerase-like protein (cupin superfamily)
MAEVGDVLYNRVTGERFTVLAIPRDDHDWGRTEIRFPPGASGPPRHVHVRTEERVSVLEGRLTVSLGGRRDRRVLGPGESLALPPGLPHRFWNPGEQPVRFVGEARPAVALGAALARLCQLAEQGKLTRRGAPKNPLEVALLFEASELYLTGIPIALQRPLQRRLAALARRRGHALPVDGQAGR